MKQYRLLLLPMVALVLMLASCSTDFKVDAPYKNITVVYGLLNIDSGRNYIRIEKAFLDEHKSALDMALVPDSSYYASLDVHLKELLNGAVVFDEPLTRVDLAAEGFPKDTGVFFNAPNYAYKSVRKLNAAYTYRLVITNKMSGETDSATTALINTDPSQFYVTQFLNPVYTLHFPNDIPQNTFTLTVRTPPNAALFEGIIHFRYVDKNVVSGAETDRSFDWSFDQVTDPAAQGNTRVDLVTPQINFYSIFSQAMGPAPAGINRYIDSADVFVWAGSKEFYNYQQVNSAQGGLTGDQVRPDYTNIRGAGVLGLFASRSVIAKFNVAIDAQTLDSLMHSASVQSLLIKGVSDH